MPLSAAAVNECFRSQAEMFGVVGLAWLVKDLGEHDSSPIVGACGVRSILQPDSVQAGAEVSGAEVAINGEEVFHWGSCSKALSATLVLVLVEDPAVTLTWDTQLAEALGRHITLPEAMGKITVRQLLTHRSGLAADLDEEEGGGEEQAALCEATQAASPTEARLAYVRAMAKKELVHEPGEKYGPYSNAGYTVLGAMVEAVTGTSWEELVLTKIGSPLGMQSLGFGFPTELAGHDEEGSPHAHGGEVEDVAWHAPAYTCHATLKDWAAFTRVHLAVLRGEANAGEVLGLSNESLAFIQQPTSPAVPGEDFDGTEGPEGYAMGWKTQWNEPDGDEAASAAAPTGVLWHYGTNFFYNSAQYLDARKGLQVLVASNSGSMVARLAIRMGIDAVIALQ